MDSHTMKKAKMFHVLMLREERMLRSPLIDDCRYMDELRSALDDCRARYSETGFPHASQPRRD